MIFERQGIKTGMEKNQKTEMKTGMGMGMGIPVPVTALE
jgi:hypothetical protein